MNILILGAAGQIPSHLTSKLLEQTDAKLVLYARDSSRIEITDPERETIIKGDINDEATLTEAMKNIDIVYLNPVLRDPNTAEVVKNAMQNAGVKRIIVTSILGIYDEVPGAFGEWNRRMVGSDGIEKASSMAEWFENSGLDYTLLRLTWLYNQDGNNQYILTQKGEPFEGAQVTRQAVAQLVTDIIKDTTGQYIGKSLGVGEPNTNWDKPSFY